MKRDQVRMKIKNKNMKHKRRRGKQAINKKIAKSLRFLGVNSAGFVKL